MTREEFEQRARTEPCHGCGSEVALERNPNNNATQVVCTNSGCRQARRPWGLVLNLKTTNKTRRKEYPDGESLDEVWARFDNRCVVCSRTRDELKIFGVGRNRQHVAPYAGHEHAGPIVPICTRCHEIANALQKDAAVMRGFVRFSVTHDEPVSPSRAGLSASGVSPDPVRPAGETPDGPVERLPNGNAHH